MRHSTSLILLLLCTSGQAAVETKERKWTAAMEASIGATPVIAFNGTVYVGAGNKLFAIATQEDEAGSSSRVPQLLYQFPQSLETSADGHYLYVTYTKRMLRSASL